MLWNRSLVMRDLETGSYWSHILGRCMDGPLKGRELEILPSTVTTWKDWSARHPETTLLNLPRTSREFDAALSGARRSVGYGIRFPGASRVYTFAFLKENPIYRDVLGERVVLLIFNADAKRVVAFDLGIGDTRVFARSVDGQFLRDDSGSFWDPLSGDCIEGPNREAALAPAPGLMTYVSAWMTFFPESDVVDIPASQ